MAINLLGSGNDRVDIGDQSAIGGATELSVLLTVKPAASFGANRIITQWSSGASDQAFLISAISAGSSSAVGFVVSGGEGIGTFRGRQTNSAIISGGTVGRLGCRWRASDGSTEIWQDGSSQSVSTWIANNSPASISNSSSAVQIAHETYEAFDGVDGDYSEVAIYTAYLSDDDMAAYGAGFSPDLLSQGAMNRVVYLPLLNTSDLTDPWSGITGTLTGGSNADHSPVIYPSGVLSVVQVAASPPEGNRRRRALICGRAA